MEIKRGDSIKFGEEYCKKYGRESLIGQVVSLTPQYFESENGLYSYTSECPGIYDKEAEEAESIYHLFGNHFENFMDCELIKGTPESIAAYQKIIQDAIDEEQRSWEAFENSVEFPK